ncbi:protein-tyrosine phosphatase family protein [Brevibacterium sp. 239c]|uniref:protein-tyrosine phosphatase family protein n=1 Tax=Brevibacterium sp. 239c TaxID=1965356 RepID=UPI0021528C7E|nr:protein-tyrosine phosphatase family protein [Brevibacterium sp. 239c]
MDFPDGRRVRGTGLRRRRQNVLPPEFAVYLLGKDPYIEDFQYRWVRWRDFRLPDSTDDAVGGLREAHRRAEFERVEITCGGGIGRTGTAMALLAVISGVNPDDAVAWMREHYTPRRHGGALHPLPATPDHMRRRIAACQTHPRCRRVSTARGWLTPRNERKAVGCMRLTRR